MNWYLLAGYFVIWSAIFLFLYGIYRAQCRIQDRLEKMPEPPTDMDK